MFINQPYYKQEGSEFVLYKPDFQQSDSTQFSESTSVSGAPETMGRFSTEEDLQQESVRLFNVRAQKAQ